jgi:type II secretory pathway component PulK
MKWNPFTPWLLVPKRTRRGSALLAVFWLIGVLALVGMGAAKLLEIDVKPARLARDRSFAKRQAEIGMAVGSHPGVVRGDPLLGQKSDTAQGYSVAIESEDARININVLANSSSPMVASRIFKAMGLPADQANALRDALMDWVDQDEATRLNGAERTQYLADGYTGFPSNRPFKSLEEVRLVRGWRAVEQIHPEWRNYFTIFGSGKVNVNEASIETLSWLTGYPKERLGALQSFRAGADGVEGTADDRKLAGMPEVLSLMGIANGEQQSEIGILIGLNDTCRHITSTGWSRDSRVTLESIRYGTLVIWTGETL